MEALKDGRSRPTIRDIIVADPRVACIDGKVRSVGHFFKGYDRCTPPSFYYIFNRPFPPLFRPRSKLLPRYLVLRIATIETCVPFQGHGNALYNGAYSQLCLYFIKYNINAQ